MSNLEIATSIPVFPEFATFSRKSSLPEGPFFCEDDEGKVAFVSEYMKSLFLSGYKPVRRRAKKRSEDEQSL